MPTLKPIPFYFVRHGQTAWNKERRLQGKIDIPLNEAGMLQAREAARLLRGSDIQKVIHSPLQRATQTAEVIAKELGVPMVLDSRWSERSLGILEGRLMKDHPTYADDWMRGWVPEGGESFEMVQRRVLTALAEQLLEKERVCIVAHGGTLSVLRHLLLAGVEVDHGNAIPHYFFPQQTQESVLWYCQPANRKGAEERDPFE
jgi:probable phosphoglycerate mutase